MNEFGRRVLFRTVTAARYRGLEPWVMEGVDIDVDIDLEYVGMESTGF